jgi:predicted phosphodiesterase
MRILLLSDLHHELWRERAPVIDPSRSRPDVVILAGDIDTGDKAVAWAAARFAPLPVLYVHGNHEAYGANLESVQRKIQAACDASDNVHFLNCGEFIYQGVRFLGATMWTDFCLFGDGTRMVAMRESEMAMNDYRLIRLESQSYRCLRPSDTEAMHHQQRAWLHECLERKFDGKTVVITHMAPTLQSVAPQYAHDLISATYASRLDALVEKADLWVHGHMHDTFDYRVGKCRVVCNPCGYSKRDGTAENHRFDPELIIELDCLPP